MCRWRGLPVVTPFAAGQALAVPRQPPTIDRDSYVAFTGTQPHANWGRTCPPMHYEVM